MFFSSKRQQYLVDQGYSFKVLTNLTMPDGGAAGSGLGTHSDELKLLAQVLCSGAEAQQVSHPQNKEGCNGFVRVVAAPSLDSTPTHLPQPGRED